jgi:hypothetical protein
MLEKLLLIGFANHNHLTLCTQLVLTYRRTDAENIAIFH